MYATNSTRTIKLAATTLAITAMAMAAYAIPLGPGAAVALSGTTVAAHPHLAGVVIVDTLRPFSVVVGGTTYFGQVQDRVVKSSATGKLDFYYRIMLDKQTLQTEMMRVLRASYPQSQTGAGISTDVDYRTDGLGFASPYGAMRSADGVWVGFEYRGPVIGPGSANSTRFSFISTNATTFNAGGYMKIMILGSTPVTLHCYQPG